MKDPRSMNTTQKEQLGYIIDVFKGVWKREAIRMAASGRRILAGRGSTSHAGQTATLQQPET